MPPSHRSSSSHHSSSSHRSSSSSHRSYSSHSSSYGGSYRSSGPSRRSTTSYSSSSRSYSSVGSHIPYRTRTNQPKGFSQATGGNKNIRTHHCKTHDYVYYPIAWRDPETNKSYKSGYYDETGAYYQTLALKKDDSYETQFQCEYCGSQIKTLWKEGAAPSCPNCGAVLQISAVAKDEELAEGSALYDSDNSYSSGSSPYTFDVSPIAQKVVWVVAIGAILSALSGVMLANNDSDDDNYYESSYYDDDSYDYDYDDYDYDFSQDFMGDEIYVDALGRTCYWYDEYDSYYDEETDCYFVYDNYVEPAVWQYWYEGISSNYGEYGWMEYDESDGTWYVEKDYGDWVKLPDRYLDEDRMWHMD